MKGRIIAAQLVIAAVISAAMASCATAPQPSAGEIADACELLKDKKSWHQALRASAKDWGAPMGFQLAVMKQESAFDARAKAPRGERKWFGLVQGDRLSSARGYAQALDTTWETYKQETGNGGASRQNFRDAADFIGWYFNTTGKRTGVGQYDYKAHYLAYHEGATGYLQGAWRGKTWLVNTADSVAAQAARYESQISDCKALKPKFLGIF
jgi:hypothetical protein